MGVLAEYLKTEAEQLKSDKAKRCAEVQEWVDSLNTLFDQIQKWLEACDPEELIEDRRVDIPGQDPSFGEHVVPTYKLSLGDRHVQFLPRARYVASLVKAPGSDQPVRAQGLVEVRNFAGPTYYLFRLADGWYIQSRAEHLRAAGNDVVPINRERFEAVVRESL